MKNRALYLLLAGLAVAYVLMGAGHVEAGSVSLAITVLTGTRASAGSVAIESNSRVIDMSDVIHLLDPNRAPLTAVTMKLRKAHCISPKFEWLEDDYIPATDTVNGTVTASGTTCSVTVDTIANFRAGDVIKVPTTGETLYVTSISSDTLICTRSIGSTAGAAISDGDYIVVIGNANVEGDTVRTLKTTTKTPQYNYTQIFRWPFGNTRTLENSEIYGGSDMAYQTKKAGLEHRIQIERAFLFGERGANTSGTAAIRYTGGVIEKLVGASAVTDQGDAYSAAGMETFMRALFRYGPARKMLFASREIISYLNLIAGAATTINTVPSSKSFPLALKEWVSGHGKLYLVTHNLLEQYGTQTSNQYAYHGWALGLDLDSMFYRYLQKSDTRIRTNIQDPSADGRTDEYLTECGLQVIQPNNHRIWYDVRPS